MTKTIKLRIVITNFLQTFGPFVLTLEWSLDFLDVTGLNTLLIRNGNIL